MIERLRIVVGDPRREDLVLPNASRQLEAFELGNRLAQSQLALKLAVLGQVIVLDEILPINFWRHRINPPPQAVERHPMNAGQESAFAPFNVDPLSRDQTWSRSAAGGRCDIA